MSLNIRIKQVRTRLKNQNKSIRDRAKALRVSASAVWVITKKQQHTDELRSAKQIGRPQKITEVDEQRIS